MSDAAPDIVDLYRSDTVLVRQVRATEDRRWVVTFDHHSIGDGFDRLGFGEDFLLANGISAIHVLGRGNDWHGEGLEQQRHVVRLAPHNRHYRRRLMVRRIARYGWWLRGMIAR